MNPRALDRMDRAQLLQLHNLAQHFSAWTLTAHHLQRLGMNADHALLNACALRVRIEGLTR